MAYVGTLAWARETGGEISHADRLELFRLAVVTSVVDGPSYMMSMLRVKRPSPAAANRVTLRLPESPAVEEAERLLHQLVPRFIVNHSIRTFLFSRLVGITEGIVCDPEILYLASLAHDVGLYPDPQVPVVGECFSLRSAEWAVKIARNAGWCQERRRRLAETIVLNLNGRVPEALGAEAHLMMKGVLVDATGLYSWRVNPMNRDAVLAAYPLLDQCPHLRTRFNAEAALHPHCRGYFASHCLGFGLLMRLAPRVSGRRKTAECGPSGIAGSAGAAQ